MVSLAHTYMSFRSPGLDIKILTQLAKLYSLKKFLQANLSISYFLGV